MRMFGIDLVAGLALFGFVAGEVLASPPPAKQTTPKPEPAIEELSATDRVAEIERLTNLTVKESQLRKPVRLSARKTWVDGQAMMNLFDAESTSTQDDQVSFDHSGYVKIGFRSSPGHVYMAECGLSKAAEVHIDVHSYDASKNPDDESWLFKDETRKEIMGGTLDVTKRRVTFSFIPGGKKNLAIVLSHAEYKPWVFHYCNITPVKL